VRRRRIRPSVLQRTEADAALAEFVENVEKVERASRSSRVTTSTSPCSSLRITLANSGRSVFAPEAFSLKMLPQPAACSSAIWLARSWSRVETRAYPKTANQIELVRRCQPCGSRFCRGPYNAPNDLTRRSDTG
jgi:hypothetical protein